MDIVMQLSRVLHVLGVALWLGGATLIAVCASALEPSSYPKLRSIAQRLVTPAMIVAWASGAVMLAVGWEGIYARAPWMHTKLLVGLLAAGASGAFTARLRKSAEAGSKSSGIFTWLFAIFLAVNTALVFLRPGS